MNWTDEQWDGFVALVASSWRQEFPEAERKAWRILLDETPAETAMLGLKRLLLEGREWRPAVSELLKAARHDPSRPTFSEAYQLIFGHGGAIRACVAGGTVVYRNDGDRARTEREAILVRAGELHPLIRPFIERQGVDRLRTLPLDDPEWGEKHRRDLEAAWDRHVEAFDGREVAAIASGARDGLRQLDPLAALGLPGPAPQLEAGPTQ